MTVTPSRLTLVTGATGHQGGAVARHLLAGGRRVRALTRDPGSQAARRLADAGAQVVAGDLRVPTTLDAALEGVGGVFSVQDFYAPGVGHDGEIAQGRNLAQAARRAGVAHLVQSTMALTPDASGIPHFLSKFAVEREIMALGLPHTFVGTVWFMDNVRDPRRGGSMTFPTLAGTLRKDTPFHMLAVDDLGAAVAQVLAAPDRYLGQRIDLAGDVLCVPEMKATYRRVTGRRPKRWVVPAPLLSLMAGEFAAQLRWHNRVGWSFTPESLHSVIGQPTTFESYLRDHAVTGL